MSSWPTYDHGDWYTHKLAAAQALEGLEAHLIEYDRDWQKASDWIGANLPDAEEGARVIDILLAELDRRMHLLNLEHRSGILCKGVQERNEALQARVQELEADLALRAPLVRIRAK